MKYIKTYESWDDEYYNKYNIGDYVLLAEETNWCSRAAKILDKKQQPIQILIETFFLETGKKYVVWVNYSEIGEKITFDEYKRIKKENFINYKIKKDADKYNV